MTNKIRDLLFRFYRKCGRFIVRHSKNPRPSSTPFLSGDTFRSLADHIYEPGQSFNPKSVKERDIVFVESELVEDFFATVHSVISFPYVLITHNGDRNIGEKEAEYLDEKIICWFAQNNTFAHPKIIPLPIGLENMHYCNNGLPYFFEKVGGEKYQRKNRILYGFSVSTNPQARQPALDALERLPSADKLTGWPTPPRYIETLSQYGFIASPEGNGLDCHRTWEALYLGVIPIVKRSRAMEYFLDLGLPIWIIDNWPELDNYDKEGLEQKYKQMMAEAKTKPLFIEYWKDLLKKPYALNIKLTPVLKKHR